MLNDRQMKDVIARTAFLFDQTLGSVAECMEGVAITGLDHIANGGDLELAPRALALRDMLLDRTLRITVTEAEPEPEAEPTA